MVWVGGRQGRASLGTWRLAGSSSRTAVSTLTPHAASNGQMLHTSERSGRPSRCPAGGRSIHCRRASGDLLHGSGAIVLVHTHVLLLGLGLPGAGKLQASGMLGGDSQRDQKRGLNGCKAASHTLQLSGHAKACPKFLPVQARCDPSPPVGIGRISLTCTVPEHLTLPPLGGSKLGVNREGC